LIQQLSTPSRGQRATWGTGQTVSRPQRKATRKTLVLTSLVCPSWTKRCVRGNGLTTTDSSEDDHFSDAHSAPSESPRNSPIPRTRVEKVSDEPSYGEVPGTDAYRKREGDAEPDEIAIIPEKVSKPPAEDDVTSPPPRSESIPKTVVEETEDTAGSETHPERKHRSDPPPDLVLKAAERTSGDASTGTDV